MSVEMGSAKHQAPSIKSQTIRNVQNSEGENEPLPHALKTSWNRSLHEGASP
jgi:hypothetical protein